VTPHTLLEWRLTDHSCGRAFRRLRERMSRLATDDPALLPWLSTLSAIALLETYERRPVARGLERAVQFVLPRRGTTCGPLQLARAPYSLSACMTQAVTRLQTSGCLPYISAEDAQKIARVWNGAATRQPGSAVGYAEALRMASRICARL
jgi:hypothetical protein